MNAQFAMQHVETDLFGQVSAEKEIHRNGRTYRLSSRTLNGAERIGIAWREPGRAGVIGGFYASERAALAQIDLIEQARASAATQNGRA